jgi:hypothetical protein
LKEGAKSEYYVGGNNIKSKENDVLEAVTPFLTVGTPLHLLVTAIIS